MVCQSLFSPLSCLDHLAHQTTGLQKSKTFDISKLAIENMDSRHRAPSPGKLIDNRVSEIVRPLQSSKLK